MRSVSKLRSTGIHFVPQNSKLKCPGASIPVTGSNRIEYILLSCKFLLKTSVRTALTSFVDGFHSVVPRVCLRFLSPKLLEAMICGQKHGITDHDIMNLKGILTVSNHDGLEETELMKNVVAW
jgi:hypothetical protein